MIEDFLKTEKARGMALFGTKHKPYFHSKTDLADWLILQTKEQDFKCFYCDTSIFIIRELINKKLLKTRKIGFGERGPVLEIDKKNNHLGYLKSNCVLACYYCNNDKSYIFDGEIYKMHFGEARRVFFEKLLYGKV